VEVIGPRYDLLRNLQEAKRSPEMFSHAQKSGSAASLFLQVDIGDFLPLLQKLPTEGLSVSQLEAIKIHCSLRLLQNQMKAEHMYFFGKVLGVRSDYSFCVLDGCRRLAAECPLLLAGLRRLVPADGDSDRLGIRFFKGKR
jgi:hypothetical protein